MRADLFCLLQKRDSAVPDRAVYDDLAAQVRLAEEVGFHTAWVAEHHFNAYCLSPSPVVTLAYLAGQTSMIRLGTGVLVLPLYDPVRLVEEIAQLDVISNGRLVVGIGAGYQGFEFRRFGQRLEEGVERTLELLDVIELALTRGAFSYEGRHYRVPELEVALRCVQQPMPEIWIAGLSRDPAVHRRIAASGYVPFLTANWFPIETFAPVRASYDAVYAGVGRDPLAEPMGLLRYVCVTKSRSEARDFAERARYSTRVAISLRNDYGVLDGVVPRDPRAVDEPTLEEIERRLIVGDWETCAERILEDHAMLRHSHVACNLQPGGLAQARALATIEAVGTQVMPAVDAELARRGVVEPAARQLPSTLATPA